MTNFLKNLRTFLSLSWLPDPPLLTHMKITQMYRDTYINEALSLRAASTSQTSQASQNQMYAAAVERQRRMASTLPASKECAPKAASTVVSMSEWLARRSRETSKE